MTEIKNINKALKQYEASVTADEILASVRVIHVHSILWLSSLITTIESLREEIISQRNTFHENAYRLAKVSEDAYIRELQAQVESQKEEIEGYKAITELAVKGLEPYAKKPNRDGGEVARIALAEIKRLLHEQT